MMVNLYFFKIYKLMSEKFLKDLITVVIKKVY